VAALAGCGSAGPAPRHGILFTHEGGAFLQVLGGGQPQRVTRSAEQPAWSPNGKEIAFARKTCANDSVPPCFTEIAVVNANGSDRRTLTFSFPGELFSTNPSWSPDGRRIVFERDLDDYQKVAIVDPRSGNDQPLGVSGSKPAWGTPGIAYLSQRVSRLKNLGKPRNSIRIIDPRTRRRRPFASPPVGYTIQAIAWSSKGELAAFETHNGNAFPPKATVYSETGRRISQFEVPRRWTPCGLTWSPGGKRLVLAVNPSHPQLYTFDPSGRHWRRLPVGLKLSSCAVSWR
jgi:dipeptidyl aminopeptidase/acylaminoacyl peptidase